MGQQFSEPPDTALIHGYEGLPPGAPESFECGCREGSCPLTVTSIPARVDDFEQVGAGGAAKLMARVVGSKTAGDAAKFRYLHRLGGSQVRHSVYKINSVEGLGTTNVLSRPPGNPLLIQP